MTATAHAALLRQGLSLLTGNGSTSLRDAVYLATHVQPTDRGRRPLILLFSDGDDTASWLTEAEVLAAARRSAAVVHTVTVQRRPFLDRLGDIAGLVDGSIRAEGSRLRVTVTLIRVTIRSMSGRSPTTVSRPVCWDCRRS